MIWTLLLTAAVIVLALNPFGLRTRLVGRLRKAFGRAADYMLGAAVIILLLVFAILSVPQLR